MPWKTSEIMDLRYKFVLLAREPEANMAELCRVFGISSSTGYKWVGCYEEQGIGGLVDQSPSAAPPYLPAASIEWMKNIPKLDLPSVKYPTHPL